MKGNINLYVYVMYVKVFKTLLHGQGLHLYKLWVQVHSFEIGFKGCNVCSSEYKGPPEDHELFSVLQTDLSFLSTPLKTTKEVCWQQEQREIEMRVRRLKSKEESKGETQ